MAGSYPDVPSRRMAWDADGSVYVYRESTANPWTEPSAATRVELNDEDSTPVHSLFNNVRREYCVIFPELREIDGAYCGGSNPPLFGFDVSADTTNGMDGTWTTGIAQATSGVFGGLPYPTAYRTDIRSMALSSKRALMAVVGDGNDGTIYGFHIYGEIAAGQTPDRLLIIDEATGLEFTDAYDYGDIPRGSSDDALEIRLKNNSATLTATTTQYTAEDLYLGSGDWYLFTTPGGSTFSSVQALASLTATSTSGLIVCRRVTPTAEDLGLHAGRFYVNTDTWV